MRIENYREQAPGGYSLALFDVYLPGLQLTLKNLKLCVSKKSGSHFVGYPSFSEETDTGEKKWNAYFSFSGEKKREFELALMDELKNFVKGPLLGTLATR